MMRWDQLADRNTIEKTIQSLKSNGIEALLTNSKEEARQEALNRIPAGSQIMTMSSVTLDTIGLSELINTSDTFQSVRRLFSTMDKKKQGRMMRQLGAAPDVAIGSVHAVTQDGHVLIASNTGSQLPAYVYGAEKVIWIVGAQKVVRTTDEAIQRIYEYVLPLEDERARKVYGSGSNVSKLLIVNREVNLGRMILIFVNEVLGF